MYRSANLQQWKEQSFAAGVVDVQPLAYSKMIKKNKIINDRKKIRQTA